MGGMGIMAHWITDANGKRIKVAGSYGISPDTINSNMLGVPSNDNIINISITSDNVHYVAPSNGYLKYKGNTTSTDASIIRIYNMGTLTTADSINAKLLSSSSIRYSVVGYAHGCIMPCKKGDNLFLMYTNLTAISVKFVSAEEV